MARLDKRGRRIGYNWWREHVVSLWSGMDELWRAQREETAMGYKTEMMEFARDHPRPTLKKVLIQCRFRHLIEEREYPDEQLPAA